MRERSQEQKQPIYLTKRKQRWQLNPTEVEKAIIPTTGGFPSYGTEWSFPADISKRSYYVITDKALNK